MLKCLCISHAKYFIKYYSKYFKLFLITSIKSFILGSINEYAYNPADIESNESVVSSSSASKSSIVSLNEFNEMFTIDYESENYSAIVKRREKKLETFLQLLAKWNKR